MDATLFLALLWGPVLVAIGLGVFISGDHYASIYRNLQREPMAVLGFAMTAMAAGIAQVSIYGRWGTFTEGVLSVLGWALLVKGVLLALVPHWAYWTSEQVGQSSLMPVIGALLLIVGGYLSIVGFAG